jgi:multiple sugar transport system permease protein
MNADKPAPAAISHPTRPAFRPRFINLSDRQLAALFLTPTLLLLLFITIFPLIWSLFLSFTRYSVNRAQPPLFIGLRNYANILSDPDRWIYFRTTAAFVIMAVGIEFLLGFGIALLLQRKFPGRGLITVLMLTPMMLSPIVVGLFWRFLYDANFGVLNYVYQGLTGAHKPIEFLTNKDLALPAIVLVDVWMWTPFMMLISVAGLSAIPKYLYEAADVDRASTWFKFRHITLPMMTPLLIIALLFRTMDAFKLFDQVYILTEGGPGKVTEVISMHIYRVAFRQFETGLASALGYVVLVVVIALANMYIRYLNRVRTS